MPRCRGSRAGDSRELSVSAQFPMMVEMERDHGSLFRAMFARRKTGKGPSVLLSFDRGMGALTGGAGGRLGPALAKPRRGARHRPARRATGGCGWTPARRSRPITSCSRCRRRPRRR